MTETEALDRMVPPGRPRKGKWLSGVIQILVTRACDNACLACTQSSNLAGPPRFIDLAHFETALKSLRGYFGVVGVFGGNPALHPHFEELCGLVRKHVPFRQRGIWCNNPMTVRTAEVMAKTFNPAHSNLNVHLNREAYDKFKAGWPRCNPIGLDGDSRHSPVHLAMKDLDVLPANPGRDTEYLTKMENTEANRLSLIADCDINRHWSALIGTFRGELRAWFCEIAASQAMLHQDEPDYPDTGVPIRTDGLSEFSQGDGKGRHTQWWREPMQTFAGQVRKHCHECGVPLRGWGELATSTTATEQTSKTHAACFRPKRAGRPVEVVERLVQLGTERVGNVVRYLENASE